MLFRIAEFLAITQRGDRSALDELEFILDQTPFDVLGTAEVGFAPPARLGESHNLSEPWTSRNRLDGLTQSISMVSRRSAPKH